MLEKFKFVTKTLQFWRFLVLKIPEVSCSLRRKLPTFPNTLPLLLWREKVGWEAVCCTFVTRCMYVRQVKRAEEEEERSNRIHGVEEMDIGGQIMSKIRTLTDHAAPSGATDAISELS